MKDKEVDIMNNWIVYIHIFPNDKKYIGITNQNPENR